MIPEEDRGPQWLRDYGYTDFSQIEADITAMQKFATKLSDNVQGSYAPHLSTVSTAMTTRLPAVPASFVELYNFLVVHRDAQDVAHQNVYNYANGTYRFAVAAEDISKTYSGTDAFAHAKVSDVDNAFEKVGIPTDSTSGEGDV